MNSTMRLAYLDPHPVPGNETESLQILQMVDALGNSGAEVHVIAPHPPQPLTAANILGHELSPRVQFHPLPNLRARWGGPFGSNRIFFWLANRRLNTLTVDALLVRNLKLAARLLRRPAASRIPLFFDTHELFANTFQEENPNPSLRQRFKLRQLRRLERGVYARADGLICTTSHLKEDIDQSYRLSTPALAAPLGYDARLAAAALGEAALPPNQPPVLLFLGSLHPWKGLSTLLEAMVQVEGALLKIVGGDGARHQVLQQQARALGVAAKIQWVPAIPPAERFRMIRTADICLLPLSHRTIASRYTSPLKLFEYMGMGKPIITADLPSMRLLLSHGTHALLTEAENPTALAAAIQTLLNDPPLARQLATAARQQAKHYSWESRAAGMLTFMAKQMTKANRV
ncbi:MAG: glycosyltransferase family 4 protein [Magnetococcales bacterium]|nr:glycosyltransferase family 4 protein [Magnetococcales bacterium]